MTNGLALEGGTISGGITVNVPGNATLNIMGNPTLDGATINSSGQGHWYYGDATVKNGGVFNNKGTFTVQSANFFKDGGGGGRFNNYGPFTKISTGNTVFDISFNNQAGPDSNG